MRCLGQVSYSVYIFHTIILFVLTRTWNRVTPIAGMPPTAYWMLILGIGMVVATLCTLTYWFIERPFLSRRMPDTEAREVQSAAATV
jgi:peptidoglycan/LPS O-acetylase OafA/YrhL